MGFKFIIRQFHQDIEYSKSFLYNVKQLRTLRMDIHYKFFTKITLDLILNW